MAASARERSRRGLTVGLLALVAVLAVASLALGPARLPPLMVLRALVDDVGSAGILLDPRHPLGTGDGHDVLAALQHPGQRQLRCSDPPRGRQLRDSMDQRDIGVEVLLREPRKHPAADVVSGKRVGARDGAGEEAAA